MKSNVFWLCSTSPKTIGNNSNSLGRVRHRRLAYHCDSEGCSHTSGAWSCYCVFTTLATCGGLENKRVS